MLNDGKYKMAQVGRAFAYDYLKRIGINTCKNSVQLKRLFGNHRLGIVENENATEQQVLNIIKKIANLNKKGLPLFTGNKAIALCKFLDDDEP
jgi:hypothetical protein